jgi:hypothetical protein
LKQHCQAQQDHAWMCDADCRCMGTWVQEAGIIMCSWPVPPTPAYHASSFCLGRISVQQDLEHLCRVRNRPHEHPYKRSDSTPGHNHSRSRSCHTHVLSGSTAWQPLALRACMRCSRSSRQPRTGEAGHKRAASSLAFKTQQPQQSMTEPHRLCRRVTQPSMQHGRMQPWLWCRHHSSSDNKSAALCRRTTKYPAD